MDYSILLRYRVTPTAAVLFQFAAISPRHLLELTLRFRAQLFSSRHAVISRPDRTFSIPKRFPRHFPLAQQPFVRVPFFILAQKGTVTGLPLRSLTKTPESGGRHV